jgi:hypothetical protein
LSRFRAAGRQKRRQNKKYQRNPHGGTKNTENPSHDIAIIASVATVAAIQPKNISRRVIPWTMIISAIPKATSVTILTTQGTLLFQCRAQARLVYPYIAAKCNAHVATPDAIQKKENL